MSSSGVNLENYLIPLEEIIRATENFSPERPERCIGDGGFGKVYKGQLSACTVAIKRLDWGYHQGEKQFRNEVDIISRCHHENIISFIGYCDEGEERIIVCDFAINGSIDYHLKDRKKMCCITWTQRLMICLGAAKGLNYLHSGVGEHHIVINRGIKSGDILLDENFMAKICDFGLSVLVSKNLPNAQLITQIGGTPHYVDPVYLESGILRKETDIYSFGVVLFEMLSGTLVYAKRTINEDEMLMTSVHRHQTQPAKLVDPDIKDQIHTRCLYRFTEMAYRCVSLDINNRPRIETVVETLQEALDIQMKQQSHHKIPLQVIKACTEDFNERNYIGKGGYGRVYKGILTWANHVNELVAVKRLDVTGFQGSKEFHTEAAMLSQYHHENIITLVGFCDDNKEMIYVYEYASRGSLDTYLHNAAMSDGLSWPQLLKICIDVASALDYLHNHVAEKHRIIHRDIKSANVLLDENWNAKLADFGLARIGLANQLNTMVITNIAGTHGYNDPQYERTGFLSKESDVYSFGVVLFEVLCGRLACVFSYNDERRFLHHLARTSYKNGELDKIIDNRIKKDIKPRTLSCFQLLRINACKKLG